MESGDALANGGEDEIVRRSAKALAACLACDICTGLLIEPLTAAECMHCFCQECITAFVVAGQNTFCPVCQREGVKTSFGPQPMRDHLRVDFMLTDLLKKVWLLQHGDCRHIARFAFLSSRQPPVPRRSIAAADSSTHGALQVSGQLASVAMSRETRVAQWHALSRVISSRDSTASEPAAKPLKQLPADGAGCVELFISAPGGMLQWRCCICGN